MVLNRETECYVLECVTSKCHSNEYVCFKWILITIRVFYRFESVVLWYSVLSCELCTVVYNLLCTVLCSAESNQSM